MKTKTVKVLTENGIKQIKVNKIILDELKLEMEGAKPYVQEYETIDNEIITDLEIISIVK